MKRTLSLLAISLMLIKPLYSEEQCCENPVYVFDEETCELPPILPPPQNCSDYETQAVGKSMMGWGLAMIAAIAIVAGTVSQSTADN